MAIKSVWASTVMHIMHIMHICNACNAYDCHWHRSIVLLSLLLFNYFLSIEYKLFTWPNTHILQPYKWTYRYECSCEGHSPSGSLHRCQGVLCPWGKQWFFICFMLLNNISAFSKRKGGDVFLFADRVTKVWWMEETIFTLQLGKVCQWCCSWWELSQGYLSKCVCVVLLEDQW